MEPRDPRYEQPAYGHPEPGDPPRTHATPRYGAVDPPARAAGARLLGGTGGRPTRQRFRTPVLSRYCEPASRAGMFTCDCLEEALQGEVQFVVAVHVERGVHLRPGDVVEVAQESANFGDGMRQDDGSSSGSIGLVVLFTGHGRRDRAGRERSADQ